MYVFVVCGIVCLKECFFSVLSLFFGDCTVSHFSFLRPSHQQSPSNFLCNFIGISISIYSIHNADALHWIPSFSWFPCSPSLLLLFIFLSALKSHFVFLPSVYFLIFPVPGLTHGTPCRLSLLSFFLYVLFYFPLTVCSYSSVSVFKRHISSVCWHLGALINICNMWFSKSGAEMQLGAATIHLAPPGEFAGLWFTNTCKEEGFWGLTWGGKYGILGFR